MSTPETPAPSPLEAALALLEHEEKAVSRLATMVQTFEEPSALTRYATAIRKVLDSHAALATEVSAMRADVAWTKERWEKARGERNDALAKLASAERDAGALRATIRELDGAAMTRQVAGAKGSHDWIRRDDGSTIEFVFFDAARALPTTTTETDDD